jgi:hypothetical protein
MTDDGLADLVICYLLPIIAYLFISFWKGDYPSWTRMGFAARILKILY